MPEAEARRPDPPISLLLRPKWLTARARALANERGRGTRFLLLSLIGMLFWAFIYTLLYKLLVYFRGVPDLGPFLAGKLLGMILIGFFSILLLSNVITALSSFFLARDLTCSSAHRSTGSSCTARSCSRPASTRAGWWCCWRCRCSPRSARRITAAGCSLCS